MNKKLLLPLLAFFAMAAPAGAFANDWIVSKVSQPSRYTEDRKTWVTVTPGMTVKDQSWISTGPRGRVVLERAKDRVTFQPNTLAGVFERPGFSVHTDFAQQSGQIRLEIDPRKTPHLAVQTPYLAAVVKGTVFTVSVDAKGAKVGVERGRVEVTDALSGERTGVRAGQQAAVDDNPATAMSLTGKNSKFEPIVVTKPFAPAVPAIQAATPSPSATTTSDDASSNGNTGDAGKSGSAGSGKGEAGGNAQNGSDNAGSSGSANGSGNSSNGSEGKEGKSEGKESKSKGKDGDSKSGENGESESKRGGDNADKKENRGKGRLKHDASDDESDNDKSGKHDDSDDDEGDERGERGKSGGDK